MRELAKLIFAVAAGFWMWLATTHGEGFGRWVALGVMAVAALVAWPRRWG